MAQEITFQDYPGSIIRGMTGQVCGLGETVVVATYVWRGFQVQRGAECLPSARFTSFELGPSNLTSSPSILVPALLIFGLGNNWSYF
jgi:hypothetical protein